MRNFRAAIKQRIKLARLEIPQSNTAVALQLVFRW
jgi:hypothetical protein